jgi:hypothetical protein
MKRNAEGSEDAEEDAEEDGDRFLDEAKRGGFGGRGGRRGGSWEAIFFTVKAPRKTGLQNQKPKFWSVLGCLAVMVLLL